MAGSLLRGLVARGAVRVIACDVTSAARQLGTLHRLPPEAQRLGAQAMAATALMSARIKSDERVVLQFEAEEPEASFYGEIDAEGAIRARLAPATASFGPGDTVKGVLAMVFSVVRRETYRGTTSMVGESLEDAVVRHLRESTQVDALLHLDDRMEAGVLAFAGGVLLERMPVEPGKPSIDPQAFHEHYAWLGERDVPSLIAEARQGRLGSEALEVLETRDVRWQCRCSPERVTQSIALLGREAIEEMIDQDGEATVHCHFCEQDWHVPRATLEGLLERIVRRVPDGE